MEKLKKYKKNFMKKQNLTEKELNNIRWEEIKKNKNKFLKDFNIFREKFIKMLLDYSIEKVRCNDCFFMIPGSKDLTSDLDITLSSITKASNVSKIFNETFLKLWDNNNSSDIFDTNLYGTGYFIEVNQKNNPIIFNSFNHKEKKYIYLKSLKNIDEKLNKKDIENQRALAYLQLIKLHKLFYNKSIKNNKNKIINKIIKIPNYQKYKEYYNKLIKNININDKKEMNMEYINRIKKIEKILNRYKYKKINHNDLIKYKKLIGEIMFYGNETYLTQGAFFHVVGINQMKIKKINKIITKNELIDSIIENYSYLYMEYQNSDNIYDFLTLSSKYIKRILDAIQLINNNEKYKKVSNLLLESKKLRTNKIYKKDDIILIKKIYNYLGINILDKKNLLDTFKKITIFIKKELPDFPIEILN